MTKSKPKYPIGSEVIYRGFIFKVVNACWKEEGLKNHGWVYNLDNFDAQRIPKSQLKPFSLENKIAGFLHDQFLK